MTRSVEARRDIAAPVDRVWDMVTDLVRMGGWSDENKGGRWLGDATGPEVGAQFRGSNRNGIHRWSTRVTVTDFDPLEQFVFRVTYLGLPISTWSYSFEPTPEGCRITESWIDQRHGWFKPLAHLATGVGDRPEHTQKSIEHTLEQLTATAEGRG
ncbi:MAG: SRPBCC family protein [Acidimicrobiales bacterium]